MKIKTHELTGAALDWAVAKCEGATNLWFDTVATHWVKLNGQNRALRSGWAQSYIPSTNWSQGGPIIEREHIALDYYHTPIHPDVQPLWEARHGTGVFEYGPTPLIAAMRCFVSSRLGDEVEIPENLK